MTKSFLLASGFCLLSSALCFAGECEVVDYSTYQKTSGGSGIVTGDTVQGDIHTDFCVTATIQNRSGGGRLGGKLIAHLVDGTTSIQSVRSSTERIDSNQQVKVTACFGTPVESLFCDF